MIFLWSDGVSARCAAPPAPILPFRLLLLSVAEATLEAAAEADEAAEEEEGIAAADLALLFFLSTLMLLLW